MIKAVKQVVRFSRGIFLIQQMRFALMGGLATVLHWLVMALMVNIGNTPIIATATGALIGAMANYVLQHSVTFKTNESHASVVPRYISVFMMTWVANLLIFSLLHHTSRLTPMYAQGITTLAVASMSYVLYKRVVFNEHPPQSV